MFSIISAPFSAIIIVGAFVLPEVIFGIIEASITLKFFMPLTFNSASTGIVGASVTILGIMAAKSMNKSGYNVRLAAGTITAVGTLGFLIPPSIMLVVMGPIMEIPVTDLFAAAIIPGILLATLYAGYTSNWIDFNYCISTDSLMASCLSIWTVVFFSLLSKL